MEQLVPITFEPSGVTAWVKAGSTVLEGARVAGVLIDAECGGRGTCGACGVRVRGEGLELATPEEAEALGASPAGIRLACRARIIGPVTVKPIVSAVDESSEPADTAQGADLVAGVDLGTTTVAAAVVAPATGRELGRAVVANRQRSFGADVLSRLTSAMTGAGADLQRLADESVADAIRAAVGPAAAARVRRVVVAGNTVMTALYCDANVSSLASYPFSVPADCCRVAASPEVTAAVATGARIEVVPPVAGFVGGDLVAGVLALGMLDAGPRMLVDVGTNAEVAIAARGTLWVASAAAGPAFEGGGIASGGLAVPGAVTEVVVSEDGEVELSSLGGAEPRWFSGAGLLSALAALVRNGHVDASGVLTQDGPLGGRFTRSEAGVLGVRFGEREGHLVMTQLDIRSLQLAKAAVRVAIESVLRAAEIRAADLEAVHVSGAFGSALSHEDVVELGLVPREVRDRLAAAGNTSLAGAVRLATLPDAAAVIGRVMSCANHVDLAGRPDFNDQLMRAVALESYSA